MQMNRKCGLACVHVNYLSALHTLMGFGYAIVIPYRSNYRNG